MVGLQVWRGIGLVAAGGAVDARMTSSVGRVRRTSSIGRPSSRSMSRCAPATPISSCGTRTVVSAGSSRPASGMSLKPTIERSRGTTGAGLAEPLEHADRDQVVGGEDGRRPGRPVEHQPRAPGRRRRSRTPSASTTSVGIVGQAVGADRRPVPREPVDAGRRVQRAGDVADPPVAEGGEVADRVHGRRVVVDHDREVVGVVGRPVEEDEGVPLVAELVDRVVGHLRGRDQQAVDLVLAERVQTGRLALRLVLRVAQDEVVAALARGVLRALDDRREERVRDVRHEHAERQRPLQPEAPGEDRRPVAEPLGRREDALARLRPDGRCRHGR